MKFCRSFLFITLTAFLFALSSNLMAQSGSVAGRVTDASDGSPLWGTNILVKGTLTGTTTDAEGKYRISNVPAGKSILIFRYVGYQTDSVTVNVVAGKTLQLDVQLKLEAVEGQEVVVTAQLQGQTAAINQQVNSNTIVNIVSSDRIQALPDANVAESIGRLPGISIQRDAGEGSKVVVRGLSPKFNSITINGERIPATDPNDRSVDLSMISQDILAGIEVFKALTPDKDGDAIGGTINLVTKSAPKEPKLNLRAQGGYNHQEDDWSQYKFDVSGSNRFFDGKLGVLATASAQKANRGSDLLDASYIPPTRENPVIEIENLNLTDRKEYRNRYSAGLNFDYSLENGTLAWNNFFSEIDRNETRRRKRYRVDNKSIEYDLRKREINTNVINSSLMGEYFINQLQLNSQFSYSRSQQKTPYSNYARFLNKNGFTSGAVTDKGPEVIPQYALEDLSKTTFQYGTFNPEKINDRDLTGQLDIKLPFTLTEDISGFIKAGGKYRDKKRDRSVSEYRTDFAVIDSIGAHNPDKFDLYGNGVLISNFIDPTFSADNFLNGEYEFGVGLDAEALDAFHNTYNSYYTLNRYTELDNYKAGEKISAGYLMAQINITKKIMLLPGFRFENTKTNYTGKYGRITGNLGQKGTIRDTVGGQNYSDLLPMIHLKYTILDGLDFRAAYTQSLSRPDYFNLVPYQRVNEAEKIVDMGNPDLKRTKAYNYDLFLSLYNRYGLFTVNGFYKELDNIDYIFTYYETQGMFNRYTVTKPVTSPNGKVYGIEFDIQTNFVFLPEPFDGILLNINATKLNSETFYPYYYTGERNPNPPYDAPIINAFRKGKMPGQSDFILNVTLGYEKGGFSGRLSVLYQGKYLQTVGVRSEVDGYSDSFTRFDASASQKIFDGLSLFANISNLTNLPEGAFLGTERFTTNRQYFGWTIDFGVKYEY